MRIIAGQWGGRTIAAPPGTRTRPTGDRVREAWLGALQFDLPGSRVLDLFAGSGALGLEALSRGAARATFVERAAPALRTLHANISALGAADSVEVVRGDALEYARRLEADTFDIAFADPPYAGGAAAALVGIFEACHFATVLTIEHAAGETLPALPGVRTRVYGDTAITTYSAGPREP
jgi:16S rRNA (guanine966-N2)-methyltransferase